MDELMFLCWRKGYKVGKILELAKILDVNVTAQDVLESFRIMFERELSDKAIYLIRE